MKLIDTFLFFNELDLLEIRLKYLDSVVDYFIITESKKVLVVIIKNYILRKIKIDFVNIKIKLFIKLSIIFQIILIILPYQTKDTQTITGVISISILAQN